jgi:hypothetical protein
LGWAELALIVVALVAPTLFVQITAKAIHGVGLTGAAPTSYAYALTLIVFCATASFLRRSDYPRATPRSGLFIEVLIVGVTAYMFHVLIDADTPVPVDAVVSPYWEYAISVAFCAGAAYAVADLLSQLVRRN